jgi:glycosyltransferase involved in cell wall biosynthesis
VAAAQARLTVLLPTYNRAGSLPSAVDSVLNQTYGALELLISDNASTDDTQTVCEAYVQRDERVRYFRQPVNRGPIPNFNWLLSQTQTEYLLMLADDDWLDPDYVERCVEIIEADRSLSIVTGATRYHEGDAPPDLVLNTNLTERSGSRRVLRYLRNSWSSAAFYGLLRTSAVQRSLPIPNVMGADWLFVASMSFSGRVLTTTTTHLNRRRGGTSADFHRIAQVSQLSTRAARNPHLAIAYNQFRDIALSNPVYASLGRVRRTALGVAAVAAIVSGHKFDVLWDALGPVVLHRRVIRLTGPLRDRWRARHPV